MTTYFWKSALMAGFMVTGVAAAGAAQQSLAIKGPNVVHVAQASATFSPSGACQWVRTGADKMPMRCEPILVRTQGLSTLTTQSALPTRVEPRPVGIIAGWPCRWVRTGAEKSPSRCEPYPSAR
jgi:hypothetical protein